MRYLLLSLLATKLFAASLGEADAAFQKKQYQEALESYQTLLKDSNPDVRLKALFRATESEALLFRYAAAVTRAYTASLPSDPVWKVRLLILRAEMARHFLTQYPTATPPVAEIGNNDLLRQTAEQWHHGIDETFEALYKESATARRRPLKDETYFIETEKADPGYVTLLDFLISRAADYYLSFSPKTPALRRPEAEAFFAVNFPGAGSAAATRAGKWLGDRFEAQRLLIPVKYPDRVRVKNRKALAPALVSAAGRLKAAGPRAEVLAEAAALFSEAEQFPQALDICRRVESENNGTAGAEKCFQLRREILTPRLSLRTTPVAPGASSGVTLASRNIKQFYFRLYPTTPAELLELSRKETFPGYHPLRHLSDVALNQFLTRPPSKTWEELAPAGKPFAPTQGPLKKMPAGEEGVYVLVASSGPDFSQKKDLIVGVPMNVTRLGLIATSGWTKKVPVVAPKRETKLEGFQVYAIDSQTGEPVAADLQALLRREWNKSVEEKKTASSEGRADFQASFSRTGIPWSLDVLARDKQSVGWLERELPLQFFSRAPYEMFLETDRPIYRPGQSVKVRVTVLKRNDEELEAFRGKEKIVLELKDANGETAGKEEVSVNPYGSAAATFTIPSGRLLGAYTLQAALNTEGEEYQAAQSFSVEEYKRPEVEITLQKGDGNWILGKRSIVRGDAKYLFGKAVAGAKIHFQVYREGFFPWLGYRKALPGGERELLEEGDVTAGPDGKFSLSFLAAAEDTESKLPVRFSVQVEGRDAGGRTVTATETYSAAPLPFQFSLKPEKAFWDPKQSPSVKVQAVNANNEGVPTNARFQIFGLDLKSGDFPTLEAQCEKLPNRRLVQEGALTLSAKETKWDLPALAEGVYRVVISSGKIENNFLLPVIAEKPSLNAEALSLSDRAEYGVGDTAEIVVGSARLKGKLFVQVWSGEWLSKSMLLNGGVQKLRVPVTAEHRAGLRFRWFGVFQNVWRGGEISLAVRRDEKKLQLTWKPKSGYEPAEKVRWDLKAQDAQGKPIDGEALVRVYDRALESYVATASEFRGELYEPRPFLSQHAGSAGPTEGTQLFLEPSRWNELLGITPPRAAATVRPAPVLRSSKSRYAYHMNGGGAYGRSAMKSLSAPMEMAAMADGARKDLGAAAATTTATAAPRSDFSETALFLPQLEFKRGAAAAQFIFPDSLTSWRASVGLLTADGKWAFASNVMTTSKDFMARLTLPRFWREGDRTEIVALLDNSMEKALQGKVTLSAKVGEKTLSLDGATKTFTVLPNGQTRVAWPLLVPSTLEEVKLEVAADAGNYRDGEIRTLPILPAKQRLVDSKVVAIESGKTVSLKGVDGAEESFLQVDPQLFSALLTSLPHLVESQSKATDSVLYRWLPLALVQSLYTSQPELKRLAGKLPKRTTPLPAWEEKDPRRQMQLEETPWRKVSRGGASELATTDLLDPRFVATREESALGQLRSYQLGNGAFPWYPGGEADLFITLSVLSAMAEAREFGVKLPEDIARKAFEYALPKLSERFTPKGPSLPLALYSAYVLSAYLDYDWAVTAKEIIGKALTVAEEHVDALTPMGKAYAAWAWRRLGNAEKSDPLLNQAMDGTRDDAVVGTYWQPEAMSWLWYHDSLDKHAFLLRTLLKLRPQDPKIAGLMKWLLFHRKGNSWESPRAAIQATFALAQGMGDLKTFKGKFRIDWPPVKETREIALDTVLEKPWRWTKTGASAPAEISYEGSALAFASLTTIFSSSNPPVPKDGLLQIERKFFKKTGKGWLPLASGDTVQVGDAIQVQTVVRSRSQFEYLQLRSPRGAGFESDENLSGYRYDKLSYYQEPKDSRDNFYFGWLPQGEYRLVTQWHATTPGDYQIAPSQLQSIYSPDLATYSPTFRLTVR